MVEPKHRKFPRNRSPLQSIVLTFVVLFACKFSIATLAFAPIAASHKNYLFNNNSSFQRKRNDILFQSENDSVVTDADMSSILEYVGKSTSTLVSLSFFSVLAWKRDAFMLTFFIGAISNAILSKILKRVLDQSRPEALVDAQSIRVKPTDPGMPSSHAMSLGFIGTFTSLNLPPISIPMLIYIVIALYYRIKINLHSIEQVLVGIVLGCKSTRK